MNTIITEDIIKECWNMLSIYTDLEYIKETINKAYPKISKKKEQQVSEEILFYLTQGKELFYASETSLNTAPLTLFYSINNLVKALYLLFMPNLSLSANHGLTIKNTDILSVSTVGDIPIHINSSGTFYNLNQIIKDDLFDGDVIYLKDIFSILPELRDLYLSVYNDEPNVILMQGKEDNTAYYKALFVGKQIEKIKSKNYSLLERNGYHLYAENNYEGLYGEIGLTMNSYGKEKNVTYRDIYGNLYCTFGIPMREHQIMISKLNAIYLCLYAYSMCVRYHPNLWLKFNNSKDRALISKTLEVSKTSMLLEILQILNSTIYRFTTYIPNVPKDLDYKDILDNLVKELEGERKRFGSTRLSKLI